MVLGILGDWGHRPDTHAGIPSRSGLIAEGGAASPQPAHHRAQGPGEGARGAAARRPVVLAVPTLMVLAAGALLWRQWPVVPAMLPSMRRGDTTHLIAKSPLQWTLFFAAFLGFAVLTALTVEGIAHH